MRVQLFRRRHSHLRTLHAVAAAFLFLSGFSALVYQVLWTRELGLFFGHTIYAVSAVLSAFMGGLALGSQAGGKLVARVRRPLAAYGWLEIAIGLSGALFWLLPTALDPLYRWLYDLLSGRFYIFNLARFAMATAILLIPAALMGATLPVISAWRVSRGSVATSVGALYAANTFGATAGALAAGFLLVERLGMVETQVSAALVNVLVGFTAIWWARGEGATARTPLPTTEPHVPADVSAQAPPEQRPARPHDRVLLLVIAVSGFTALAYEVVWTRALVFYVGTTTHAFTSMLAVYLLGLACGSAAAAHVVNRLRNPVYLLGALQLICAVSCSYSLVVLAAAAPRIDALVPPDASWLSLLTSSLLKSIVTMLLPTLLFGATFPLVLRLSGGSPGVAVLVGRVYAFNTWGALAGAVAAGFVLIPLLGIRGTLLVCALSNVVVAIVAWTGLRAPVAGVAEGGPAPLRWVTAVAATVLVGAAVIAAEAHLHRTAGSERIVYYAEGNTATVSVVREVSGTKTLYIDKVPVAATDPIMLTDQKTLAHLPMLLHPDPRRVLTVGFGSGGASWSFARYDRLEGVDCVEIDPAVFGAAPHLQESNHAVWQDPRFRLIIEDARSYLAYTPQQYDVISTDCTDLRYKSNASLYTTEYFGLCRRRLRANGMVVVWMPLGGLDEGMFKLALRTFQSVLPHASLWYLSNYPTHYALLVGSTTPLRVDTRRVVERLAEGDVRQDLAEIGLDRPAKILTGLLLDEAAYAAYVGEGPVNSDRYPLLEFIAPRRAYRFALSQNLASLAMRKSPVEPLLDATGMSEDLLAAVRRAAAAAPALLAGHVTYQRGTLEYASALDEYRRAAALDPDDPSIPALIHSIAATRDVWIREYEARVAAGRASREDRLALARLYSEVDRASDAIVMLRAIVSSAGTHTAARRLLAAALAAAGDTEGAIAEYRRVLELAPDSAEAHNDLGLLLLGRRDLAAASTHFERASQLDPGSAAAFHNLGLVYATRGDARAAERHYREALARDSRLVEAWGNLAALLAASNRRDEAIAALESLLRVDPTVEVARQMLSQLKPI
jgi:spermidine synthase